MRKTLARLLFGFGLFWAAPSLAKGPIPIQWWHAMGGALGVTLQELTTKFNKSQSDFEVVPVFRGNYTETLNASVAAFRGKRAPHIAQVFEVGTATMLSSTAIYPVEDLLKKYGEDFPKDRLLKPIASYYSGNDGRLYSMPFNSSTPILYLNIPALKKAGIADLKRDWTWEELLATARKVVETKAAPCGLTVGWHSWILLETGGAMHGIPFAEKENGFSGLSTHTLFNQGRMPALFDELKGMMKTNAFRYEGRRSDPTVNAFTNGKCAMAMVSSGDMSTIKGSAKFEWDTAFLPHFAGTTPGNSIIGGASLWVFRGHPEEEYRGVAKFLAFLIKPENAAFWHQKTGYLPVTLDAYELSQKSKFYAAVPQGEIAIKELLRGSPGPYSRGIRLGNFTQIREIIDEELERLWAGRVPDAKTAFDRASERADLVLGRFARLAKLTEVSEVHTEGAQ